jgi:hypothetical protein
MTMTTQHKLLATARKPLIRVRCWTMGDAAGGAGDFLLCALLIDNFSPLNMRGLGLAISTVGIAAAPCCSAWRQGTSTCRWAR